MTIKVNTIETAPEGAKETLEEVKSAYGFLPNLIGVFSNSPEAAKAYWDIANTFQRTSLSPLEQQIVLLTASFENGCDYCMAAHTTIAQMQNLPEDVIDAIRDGRKIEDEKLEALRQFASEITDKRGYSSEEAKKRFHDAGYTVQNALEVILGITQKTLSNYTNHLAETPLDEQFSSAKWDKSRADVRAA